MFGVFIYMLLAILRIWCNVTTIFDAGVSTSFSNKGFEQKARDQTKKHLHCVKNVRIRSYSGSYFPAFGLNIA